MKQPFDSDSTNLINFRQSNDFLDRPRLYKLLTDAMDYPLVAVYAGAGYGKTHTVYSFLQGYKATTIWLQLTERDNITTRFWENYTNMVSLFQPEAKTHLNEIGFPNTDEAFMKYNLIMREIAALSKKHIMIYDDFHLLHNPAVLRFFERALNIIPSNVTIVLISRTTPELNIVGMMMTDRVFIIREDTLCFTEDEIAEYFSQLGLPVTRQDIRNIYDDTQGWAFAISMIGRSLIKEAKYERYALEAMRKNIFRLIESELSQMVSERLCHFLLRVSLIDHLAASLVRVLANDDTLVKEMESINAYIRYDFNMDTYLIHHLLLDYLRQEQHEFILTDEERRETYQIAGEWCDANGYHMDAFSYYEKSENYSAIARKVGEYNMQMPLDMAKYASELFNNAPEEEKLQNPIFPGMHVRLKINIGQFDEDSITLARRYAEDYEARSESPERYRALAILYFNWAFLLTFMCTYNDAYDFEVYFKKFGECYRKNPFKTIGAFNLVPISAWASLVGTSRAGAQEEYIGAMTRLIPATSALGKGFLVGFDDLAYGELCFYRGEFDAAEQHLKQSFNKGRECDQYVTYNKALAYLMRIAFFRGDLASASKWLQEMESPLNEKDYGVRYTMYDIAYGLYYLTLGRSEQISEWLKGDFSPYAHPAFLENYANRIKAQYHYVNRQHSTLLAFIENEMEKQTILFGKIELMLLQALSLYQLKRRSEAIAALTEAYALAESNRLIVIFTQYGKDMRTLTAAALKDNTCTIPKTWLENINRKSAAYAKRQSHIISEYISVNNIYKEITLTNRETQILNDLSQGLSRSEIAASQNISPNTVKMITNIIYDKLHANSLADAIRIAADRGLFRRRS